MARFEERDLFAQEVLHPIGVAAERLGEGAKVDGFLSMEGHLYDRELMVVGRAVNGWGSGISAKDLAEPIVAERWADEVSASVGGHGPCPMKWVTDHWHEHAKGKYNTAQSAFWRVIRRVTDQLQIADVDDASWPSHLVWSNLYKVSPHETGNPSTLLGAIQRPGCLALLEFELSIYRPHRLLFLTGQDWAEPFLGQIGFHDTALIGSGLVEAVGTTTDRESGEQAAIVVAAHPQGKPEDSWVREVVAAFQK